LRTCRSMASRRCWCSGAWSWVMTRGGSVRPGIRPVFMHQRRKVWAGRRAASFSVCQAVEVGLPTVLDGAASVGEPGKEGTGLGGLLFGLVGLRASQRPLLRRGA
jgi:hypothetical protein